MKIDIGGNGREITDEMEEREGEYRNDETKRKRKA